MSLRTHFKRNDIVYGFIIFFILFISSLWTVLQGIADYRCKASWADSGYKTRHSWSTGCQVRMGKKWYPSARIRFTE